MTLVMSPDTLNAKCCWKKFGSSNGFGNIICGFSFFGDDNIFSGIYQRRPHKDGVSICKMRFYRPPVHRSTDQGIQRDRFQAAFQAWKALTDEERAVWRLTYLPLHQRGYNVFLSQYIDSH